MKTLITGGTVVSMDPAVGDLDRGDVLIDDGVIMQVAGRIDAPDAQFPVASPAGTIVSAGHPGLVDTVLVAGRVVKRDGRLVDISLPTLQARLLESRRRIAAAAGIPLDGTWIPQTDKA